MFLNELEPGQTAHIATVGADLVSAHDEGKHKVCPYDKIECQRLYDLGIIPGTEIKALYKAPSGNITAYLVRGTVFALRGDTARKIKIDGSD